MLSLFFAQMPLFSVSPSSLSLTNTVLHISKHHYAGSLSCGERQQAEREVKSQTLSFGLLITLREKDVPSQMNPSLLSFHACLVTAFRPFARHAQPNNLAGRLSIFSRCW